MSTIEHDYAPICDLYEQYLGPTLFEPYAIDLARHVAGDCAEGSVLEMACGTGIVTRQLRAHLAPTVALTATNINPGMLDYAQRRLNSLERITWKQADMANLPFPDTSFDVTACQFGLMFVQDKDRAFREIRRVLVKGGLLAFSVWDRMENNPWGIIAHETVGGFFPENPPQFFKTPCSFYDVDILRSLLTASGFDRISPEGMLQPHGRITGDWAHRRRADPRRNSRMRWFSRTNRRGSGNSLSQSWWRQPLPFNDASYCGNGTSEGCREPISLNVRDRNAESL